MRLRFTLVEAPDHEGGPLVLDTTWSDAPSFTHSRGVVTYGWYTQQNGFIRYFIRSNGHPGTREAPFRPEDKILCSTIQCLVPPKATIWNAGPRGFFPKSEDPEWDSGDSRGLPKTDPHGEEVWNILDVSEESHRQWLPHHADVPESQQFYLVRGGNGAEWDVLPEGVGFATAVPTRAADIHNTPVEAAMFKWFGMDRDDPRAANKRWPAYDLLMKRMDYDSGVDGGQNDIGWWIREKFYWSTNHMNQGLHGFGAIPWADYDCNGHYDILATMIQSWLDTFFASFEPGANPMVQMAIMMRQWQLIYAHAEQRRCHGFFASEGHKCAFRDAYEKTYPHGYTGNSGGEGNDYNWSHTWIAGQGLYAILTGCPDAVALMEGIHRNWTEVDPAHIWNGADGSRRYTWFMESMRFLDEVYALSPDVDDVDEFRASIRAATEALIRHTLGICDDQGVDYFPNRNAAWIQAWQDGSALKETWYAIKRYQLYDLEPKARAMIDYQIDMVHVDHGDAAGNIKYEVPYMYYPETGARDMDQPMVKAPYCYSMLWIASTWRQDAGEKLQRCWDTYLPYIGLTWQEHVDGQVARPPYPTWNYAAHGTAMTKILQAPAYPERRVLIRLPNEEELAYYAPHAAA